MPCSLAKLYPNTRYHIPEDTALHSHRCKNLKSKDNFSCSEARLQEIEEEFIENGIPNESDYCKWQMKLVLFPVRSLLLLLTETRTF
jgi:hypothetical protein